VNQFALLVPDELIERIAERAAAIVLERSRATVVSPYLTVAEAAEYLRCSRQRIYDLLSARRLSRHHDGRRVLIACTDLEEYLSGPAGPVAPSLPCGLQTGIDPRRTKRAGNR
jgi:excisionase family DNA binding protein